MRIKTTIVAYVFSVQYFENTTIVAYVSLRVKPGVLACGRLACFFKIILFLCRRLYICVYVCLPPRLLITNGVMWHDMDPI